jgi:hypothetical protein
VAHGAAGCGLHDCSEACARARLDPAGRTIALKLARKALLASIVGYAMAWLGVLAFKIGMRPDLLYYAAAVGLISGFCMVVSSVACVILQIARWAASQRRTTSSL